MRQGKIASAVMHVDGLKEKKYLNYMCYGVLCTETLYFCQASLDSAP